MLATVELNEEGTGGILKVGTGFFISKEGHVMTNATITHEASHVWVEHEGLPYEAQLLGYDPQTNLSILKIANPPENVSSVSLTDTNNLPEPGTLLIGITCKLGMDPGPVLGMVSGHNTYYANQMWPTTYIRTDIPHDGAEGGSPVFDLNGRFIGIMVVSLPEIRSSFLLPAAAAKRIRDDIIFSGRVAYSYLGLEVDQGAVRLKGQPIVVSRIVPDSPADEANLEFGDVVLSLDGKPTESLADLRNITFFARPGQLLPIRVRRGKKELQLSIRLVENPHNLAPANTK